MRVILMLITSVFALTISLAQPVNDNCAGAIELNLSNLFPCPFAITSSNFFVYQNDGATPASPYPSFFDCGADPTVAAAEVWFTFTPQGENVDILLEGLQTPNLAIFQGNNCTELIPFYCTSSEPDSGFLESNLVLEPGTKYYMMVAGADPEDQGEFSIFIKTQRDCNACLFDDSFTAAPTPVNGTYQSGDTVNFCYTINNWDMTGIVEWPHSLEIQLGDGWDKSSFVPTPPPSCDGNGLWGWYNEWTSCNTGETFGPGFAYESSIGVSCGGSPMDNDPGNNWGDGSGNCAGIGMTAPALEFCWTVVVDECLGVDAQADLNILIDVHSDGESGSWIQFGCNTEADFTFLSSANCIDTLPPLVEVIVASCPDLCDGGLTFAGNGPGPWDYTLISNSDSMLIFEVMETMDTITTNDLCSGAYTLTLSNTNDDYTQTVVVQIEAGASPIAVAENTGPACPGESIKLIGTSPDTNSNISYQWTGPDGFLSTEQNPIITPQAGYYYLEVNIDGCTSSADSTLVEIAPVPEITLSSDTLSSCAGDTLELVASGASSYIWKNADGLVLGTSASLDFVVSTEETLHVEGTNNFGCSDTAYLSLNLLPEPIISISADTSICQGGFATLSASGGFSYQWDTGDTTATIEVMPMESTTFMVMAMDTNACSATAEVTVSVNANLAVDAGEDQIKCPGETFVFNAVASGGVPPYQYTWNDPENTSGAFLLVIPDTTTTYTVTLTDAMGCTTTNAVTAELLEPSFILTAQPPVICSGQKSTLSVENGNVVEWSTGATATSIDVTPGETTSYSVTVLSPNNCLFTSEVTVEVYLVPELPEIECSSSNPETITFTWPVTPDSFNIVVHTGQNGEMIANGIIFQDLEPEETVAITMEIFGENDCVYPIESSCSTSACPELQLEIQEVEDICLIPGLPSINLEGTISGGNGNGSLVWAGPGVSLTGTFNPFVAGPGTHTITLNYFENNCSISESIMVNVLSSLSPPVINCSSTDIAVEYSWDDVPGAIGYDIQVVTGQEGLLIGTVFTVIDLEPGELVTIEVTAIGPGVCGNSSAEASCIALSCDDLAIELNNNVSACYSNGPFSIPATITNGLGNGTFQWAGTCVDPTTGQIDPQACGVGIHSIFVTYLEGNCIVTDETTFTILAPSSAQFAATPTICFGNAATVIFTGPNTSGLSFQWDFDGGLANTGVGSGPHLVHWDSPGEKTISLTVGSNGCSAGPYTQTILVQEQLSPADISCEPGPGLVTFNGVPDPEVAPISYAVFINSTPILPPAVIDNQILLEGLIPGDTVTLALTIQDPGPCDNVMATYSCVVEDCPEVTIAIEQPETLCLESGTQPFILEYEVLGVNLDGTLSWSGAGIIDSNSGLFSPAEAGLGLHSITLTYEDSPCTYSTTTEVEITQPPILSNFNLNCNEEGSHYFLTFDVENEGDTYTVTSDSVASGETLDQSFELEPSCRPVNFELIKSCDCISDAGLMAEDLLCGIGTISAQFLGGGELDFTDLLQFYLHDNSGNMLGNVIAKRNIPFFTFDPNQMEYGQVYYVSAVVGPNKGAGQIDLDDPCLSVSVGQPIVFSQNPVLVGSENQTICSGQSVALGIELPVSATVNWIPSNALSCANCPVTTASPAESTTYVAAVTDEYGCMTEVETSVFVNEFPPGTFPETPLMACPSKSFEFCLPGAVAYSWTGPNGFSTNNQCLFIPTYLPSMAGIYTAEVTLVNGCTLTESIEVITDEPLEINYITPDTTVCPLEFFTLRADVEGADHYIWFPASNVSCQNCASTTAFINGTTTFTLVALAESGCQLTQQFTVTQIESCNGFEIFMTEGASSAKHNTALFPNPANEQLSISTTSELKEVKIFTVEGKLVAHEIANGQEFSLDINHLTEGTYFAHISTDEGRETQKFVIMR